MVTTSSSISNASLAKAKAFSSNVQNSMLLNLVSEWTFNNIDGVVGNEISNAANYITDEWGINDGTAVGTPVLKDADDCISGKCLSFNGSSDYINCGNLVITPDADFTYSSWVKLDSTSWNFVMGGPGSHNYTLYTNHGGEYKPWFYLSYEGDTSKFFTGKIWSLNDWHHLVVTRKGNDYTIYQDGLFGDDYNYDTTTSLSNLYIGGNNDRKSSGLIDDIRIYNAALSSSQIKQNYIAGLNSILANGNISKEEYNQRIESLGSNL